MAQHSIPTIRSVSTEAASAHDGTKASDEPGNSCRVVQAYGIGSVSGSEADPKFVLPANGSSDALVVLSWQGNGIFGVTFDLDMAGWPFGSIDYENP